MDICLIAVTGWGQDENKRHALEAGFDTHMIKPVDPDQLRGLLRQLVISGQNKRRSEFNE